MNHTHILLSVTLLFAAASSFAGRHAKNENNQKRPHRPHRYNEINKLVHSRPGLRQGENKENATASLKQSCFDQEQKTKELNHIASMAFEGGSRDAIKVLAQRFDDSLKGHNQ
jgi:hypothetical protein